MWDARLSEIEELYKAKLAKFVRVCTAILGDEDRARDAVQEGFAQAIRSRRSFRGEGSLEAWVWRAVVNSALKQRRRPEARLGEELPEPKVFEDAPHSSLLEAIARLPDRQRVALFLRYFADLDYRSIAGALGVQIGTVSATLNAAHRALRETLQGVDV